MKLRLLIPVIAFASIVTATGCKKKAADDGNKTADKPAEKVAAATCSDKALKHTNPNFCVDLPAGYVAKPEKKDVTDSMTIEIERTSDKEGFVLSWELKDQNGDDAIERIKHPDSAEKIVEQGALANGGYFVRTVANNDTTENKDFFTVYSVVKGSKSYVTCFGMNADQELIKDVMKTCNALHVD